MFFFNYIPFMLTQFCSHVLLLLHSTTGLQVPPSAWSWYPALQSHLYPPSVFTHTWSHSTLYWSIKKRLNRLNYAKGLTVWMLYFHGGQEKGNRGMTSDLCLSIHQHRYRDSFLSDCNLHNIRIRGLHQCYYRCPSLG